MISKEDLAIIADTTELAGLVDVKYEGAKPEGTNQSNICTDSERGRMRAATAKALETVKRALANYDESTFRKWFGRDNEQQPDINVK